MSHGTHGNEAQYRLVWKVFMAHKGKSHGSDGNESWHILE